VARGTAKKDQIAQRRHLVATMRLAHLTQQEIADRLGVSVGTINADLKAVREEWAERRRETYDDLVAEELAKLDRLERALLPLALQGQGPASDRVLSIMDRRARLLGLDRPTRHEVTMLTQDLIEAEIQRLEAELAVNDRG